MNPATPAMLLDLMLFKARRGPNAPVGMWLATYAGTFLGSAAWEAAELLGEMKA